VPLAVAAALGEGHDSARFELQVTEGATLAPFLNIVPTTDGDLWIHAVGTGPLVGTVYANTEIGPGRHRTTWAMNYSEALRGYVNVEAVSGLHPAQDDYGSLSITTTHGLDSGEHAFRRYYVPPATPRTLVWPDGAFELDIPTAKPFATATYLAAVPSWGLPQRLPLGHRQAGEVYSVRASGTSAANRPLVLRMYYKEALQQGADPHWLAILYWDAGHDRWSRLDGALFSDREYLSAPVDRLTSYALAFTPTWRDTFNDHTGLSGWSSVVWGGTPEDPALVLASGARSGQAISVPIPAPAESRWGRLRYTATADPPSQILTVDLLRPDGTVVRSDVPSGADLSDLLASQYPALRLRARFVSTVAGASPALYAWQLAWRADAHRCYLPLILIDP
jgi:hypothetical protein